MTLTDLILSGGHYCQRCNAYRITEDYNGGLRCVRCHSARLKYTPPVPALQPPQPDPLPEKPHHD
jgi:hypothetical protein